MAQTHTHRLRVARKKNKPTIGASSSSSATQSSRHPAHRTATASSSLTLDRTSCFVSSVWTATSLPSHPLAQSTSPRHGTSIRRCSKHNLSRPYIRAIIHCLCQKSPSLTSQSPHSCTAGRASPLPNRFAPCKVAAALLTEPLLASSDAR